MKRIELDKLTLKDRHQYMIGSIGPRPIAWVSSCDHAGRINLSPFSFFNCFSSNPPILVFSPSLSGRTGLPKDTLLNVKEHPEVVINIVTYDMAQKMNITSGNFDRGINEFREAGLTEVPSEIVRPPRVGEAAVQFECKVNDIISLGSDGASGNLVICQALLMHVKEDILDEAGRIDPRRIDLIGRMGRGFYCRAIPEALFELAKKF